MKKKMKPKKQKTSPLTQKKNSSFVYLDIKNTRKKWKYLELGRLSSF
jgi:hypothetical protein